MEPEYRSWIKLISFLHIIMKMPRLYTRFSSGQKRAQVRYNILCNFKNDILIQCIDFLFLKTMATT